MTEDGTGEQIATTSDISAAVLSELEGRKGFDWWWDDLDEDIQQEIRDALTERVADLLGATDAPPAVPIHHSYEDGESE